jgi:hypothetical protein
VNFLNDFLLLADPEYSNRKTIRIRTRGIKSILQNNVIVTVGVGQSPLQRMSIAFNCTLTTAYKMKSFLSPERLLCVPLKTLPPQKCKVALLVIHNSLSVAIELCQLND